MKLTSEQCNFFDTFGYLAFSGLFADSVDWIAEEFERVFQQRTDIKPHDGTKRTCIVPFIDQSERLCTLLDDPRIVGIATGLLGENFNYLGGDGNFYVGDTGWHSDGGHPEVRFIKMAFYLDAVTQETGCLRVIPGSHQMDDSYAHDLQRYTRNTAEYFGIRGDEIPAVTLETKPGDLVVFNHNLKHASFGGSRRRRMFTLNLCEHCRTESQIADLKAYIGVHDRFWIEQMHSEVMRQTASPKRMRHLQQVIEHESHLAERTKAARLRMEEPSRG